ncbi:U4/U6 small nuclear ribonucleoprotein Prp3 like protein [Aduncisulcus paluster]|uniref:U4/U6 small nuclear ribonucleoprotein Prp3 like protein n=1 Tax=Aduncisulcus paluster TaxID=2918883 RepID=A0ABQ5KG41_9EUKA|nr:U4/U6 small nuclear ribonucleoprotein Prp3 like protein [Aduncisulcus paluster]
MLSINEIDDILKNEISFLTLKKVTNPPFRSSTRNPISERSQGSIRARYEKFNRETVEILPKEVEPWDRLLIPKQGPSDFIVSSFVNEIRIDDCPTTIYSRLNVESFQPVVFLTSKEKRKQRKKVAMEKSDERHLMIKAGVIKHEPKVKLSAIPRVLAAMNPLNPTEVSLELKRAHERRIEEHEQRNADNKKSDAERLLEAKKKFIKLKKLPVKSVVVWECGVSLELKRAHERRIEEHEQRNADNKKSDAERLLEAKKKFIKLKKLPVKSVVVWECGGIGHNKLEFKLFVNAKQKHGISTSSMKNHSNIEGGIFTIPDSSARADTFHNDLCLIIAEGDDKSIKKYIKMVESLPWASFPCGGKGVGRDGNKKIYDELMEENPVLKIERNFIKRIWKGQLMRKGTYQSFKGFSMKVFKNIENLKRFLNRVGLNEVSMFALSSSSSPSVPSRSTEASKDTAKSEEKSDVLDDILDDL